MMDSSDADIIPRRWNQVAGVTCALMGALCLRIVVAPSPEHWMIVVAPAAILALLTVILSAPQTELFSSQLSWVGGLAALYIVGAVSLGDCAQWLSVDRLGLALFSIATATLGTMLVPENQAAINQKTDRPSSPVS